MKESLEDTIIAIATPVGESAIGVLRLSGKNALKICSGIFSSKTRPESQETRTVQYGTIRDPLTGKTLDKILLTVFNTPNSFTGEDMAELSCHGNPYILKEVQDLVLSKGARLAEPGEFTLRAYLNGKMDLTQAEAVNDLIRAHTQYAKSAALSQLEGKFKNIIEEIHRNILDLLAHIEAGIDHSDLEEDFLNYPELIGLMDEIIKKTEGLLNTAQAGKINREGLKIAIVGSPNTGKSSLMNALLEEDRVIVSDLAGTTRDVVEDELNIRGISVRLLDTAGVRNSEDKIEQKGIERTIQAIEKADIRIVLLDGTREPDHEDERILELAREKKNIYVINKMDMPGAKSSFRILDSRHIKPVPVSALTKNNLDKIEEEIQNFYFSYGYEPGKDVLVTNARQEDCLKKAASFLHKAIKAAGESLGEEFIASDIRKARIAVEEITGKTTDDAILDRIFSKFCIGK